MALCCDCQTREALVRRGAGQCQGFPALVVGGVCSKLSERAWGLEC